MSDQELTIARTPLEGDLEKISFHCNHCGEEWDLIVDKDYSPRQRFYVNPDSEHYGFIVKAISLEPDARQLSQALKRARAMPTQSMLAIELSG